MIDLATTINTEHRAGRMLAALVTSENRKAKVLLTTDLRDADGGSRMHQTFAVKSWQGRSGTMLTVEVAGSGDWNTHTRAIKMFHVDVGGGRIVEANDSRNRDRLLRYAAECAIAYAWCGTEGLPTPANGTVEVLESEVCGACGAVLTDPESIARGVGPTCANKATGTRTIAARPSAPALFTTPPPPPVQDEADDDYVVEDEDGELARERYYDRIASEQTEIDRAHGQF